MDQTTSDEPPPDLDEGENPAALGMTDGEQLKDDFSSDEAENVVPDETAAGLEKQLQECLSRLSALYDGIQCYPFLLSSSLTARVVDDVYVELQDQCSSGGKALLVIVDSGGGDIHAAYNLAQLFRKYGPEQLLFVVPRWAKSAATLLVAGGDKILMTPVAELGPIDPQITEFNPLETRFEQFSPLHIESTLELIREEFRNGHTSLAEGLLSRLQFPLTLGSFKTSLEVGKEYLTRLLSTRMLKTNDLEVSSTIAQKFTIGYQDHGFCIGCDELKDLGMKAEELTGEALTVVWQIHLLNRKRQELDREAKRRQMDERLRDLPPELLQQLPERPVDVRTTPAQETVR